MSKDRTIKQILEASSQNITSFSVEDIISFLIEMLKHKDVRVDDFDFDKVTEWVGTSGSRPSKVMLGHKINIELFIPKGVIDNVKDNQKG